MLRAFTLGVVAFLLAPLVVVLATSFTTLNYISFPPRGFTLRWFVELAQRDELIDSLILSAAIAAVTAVLSSLLGGTLALAFVRYRFPGRELLNAFFMSPLILPTVVIGIALLQFYSQIRIAGVPLSTTPASVVIGHVIITVPYAIRLISASLAGLDRSIELAARSLGATPIGAFLRVTLPLITTGLLGSAVFTFIVSFDNITVSVFLATPRMVTLPVRIYTMVEHVTTPLLAAVSAVLMVFTMGVIVLIERTLGVRRLVSGG